MASRPGRSHLAARGIAVVVAAPIQLPLALAWDQPIDRTHATPGPTPVAPVAALRRVAA